LYRATEQGESYEALLARVEDFLKHEILPLEEKMKRVRQSFFFESLFGLFG